MMFLVFDFFKTKYWFSSVRMMRKIAPNSRARKEGKERGRRGNDEEYQGKRTGMLTTGNGEPSQQHVALCVKMAEWGFGTGRNDSSSDRRWFHWLADFLFLVSSIIAGTWLSGRFVCLFDLAVDIFLSIFRTIVPEIQFNLPMWCEFSKHLKIVIYFPVYFAHNSATNSDKFNT